MNGVNDFTEDNIRLVGNPVSYLVTTTEIGPENLSPKKPSANL